MDPSRGRRYLEGWKVKGEKAFVVIKDWTCSV